MASDDTKLADEHPTETSPLLASDTASAPGTVANTDTSSVPSQDDEATLERQPSSEDRQKQYEGMPEVMKQMKYILPAIAIGVLLAAADQTIIVTSYGRIGSDLNALSQTSWIATAYFLTLTSFQPLYGKLSDVFGRKPCLLFAYVVFGLGCLFCGLAQDMTQLIAARAFAGIGAGGMTTVVSILLSDIIPLRNRGTWQGYVNIVFATGASSGAPLGGVLADTVGWRWAFLGQVPLCAVAFVTVFFAIHLPKRDDVDWRKKLARVDFLGAAVLISAVFFLLLALDRGSNVTWRATITIVSISVSLPLFVLFVFGEMRIAKEPFAPGHILFNRSMVGCYLCNFFAMAGYLATIFYLPLYWQAIDGTSAAGAGLRLVPGIIGSVCGSLFGGIYMKRTGKYYWLTILAYTALLLGTTGIFLFSGIITNSTLGIIICMTIGAFGSGIGVTATLIGLIANASRDDQAVVTACSYLFRSLGSVFGVSMSATVANQALRTSLAAELPSLGFSQSKAIEIAEKVRQSLAYLKELEPEVRAVVSQCYEKSTSAAFALQIGLVAGAAISAWFIREKALSS
ncbi:hypothetical protein LTR12_007701 [Friedmanniomyces endolithicus]|nr:hypothetical protein LTR12_007701 [Friedmanniomyces endolithicus]